ncbi:portal protein [Mesorhizobium sp.]|uniref:portal protein n=1 Tax=Mesorhizobium sp. TaxID=1871066 RepID=UPI0025810111|nr:portal protein [Mesorhizobium sp.]
MASDSRAHDILSRQAELESERSQYEAVWEAVSEFCDPDAPDVWSGRRGAEPQAERQQRRGARVYANTINSAANRLAAGLESLIIPQSEKWHGLSTAAVNDEESDEEKEWAEALRDFLFALRYSANSNFVPATQACLRNVVRYGPAYLYAEEGFGGTLIRYASNPGGRGLSLPQPLGPGRHFPPPL